MRPQLHLGLRIAVDDGVELRPLRLEDAEPIYYLVEANRARLAEWLPWVPSIRMATDEAAFIRSTHGSLEAGTGLSCAAGYEGRGLVTKAARALTTFLVQDLGLHRVAIRAGTENRRSRAVAERLGFRLEGTQRHGQLLESGFIDLAVYSMLAPEWPTNGAH
jgi:ribosomal-protein-serine acetyltransferase